MSHHLYWPAFYFRVALSLGNKWRKIGRGRVFAWSWLGLLAAMHYINHLQSKSRFGFFLWRVGTSDILLDAVRSCVPSTFIGQSVDIEAVALGNSVSVHYTVDLGSTNLSIPNLSMYPRPSSSSRPPSRTRYRPLSALHHPTRTRTLYSKVCIFHHVICSSANLLSVIVTPSHWLHVKPLSRYVARDQSDTHLPEINKLHKNYSLLLVFAEPSTNLFDLFSSIRLMI